MSPTDQQHLARGFRRYIVGLGVALTMEIVGIAVVGIWWASKMETKVENHDVVLVQHHDRLVYLERRQP